MLLTDDVLKDLESVTDVLLGALVNAETSRVETLVVEQCRLINELSLHELQARHRGVLRALQPRILEQQQLVEQALSITNHFLNAATRRNSFSVRG